MPFQWVACGNKILGWMTLTSLPSFTPQRSGAHHTMTQEPVYCRVRWSGPQYGKFEELLPILACETLSLVGCALHDWSKGIASGLQGGLTPKMADPPNLVCWLSQAVHPFKENPARGEASLLVLVEYHLEYEIKDLIQHCSCGSHQPYLVLWEDCPFGKAT